MFKFSKDQSLEISKLQGTLNDAAGNLTDLLDKVNEDVGESVRLYHAAADALEAKLTEMASKFRDEFDEKSEGWQESDKGQAVSEWIDGLENHVSNEVEKPEFDELFGLQYTERDDFAEIPTEPEEG